MILHWIYYAWHYFWKGAFYLLLVLLALGVVAGSLAQLPVSKSFLKENLTSRFNEQFEGNLMISELDGFLPFSVRLNDVFVTVGDSALSHPVDTVLSVKSVRLSVDLWNVIQQNYRIKQLAVYQPKVHLHQFENNDWSLKKAFTPVKKTSTAADSTQAKSAGEIKSQLSAFQLYAPSVSIINGSVDIDDQSQLPDWFIGGESPGISSLNLEMLAEVSSEYQFLDISQLEVDFDQFATRKLDVSGQVYRDSTHFELNRLFFQTDQSYLVGDISLSSNQPDSSELLIQPSKEFLKESTVHFLIDSSKVVLEEFAHHFKGVPNFNPPVFINGNASGDADEFSFNDFEWYVLNSGGIVNGSVQHILNRDEMRYRFELSEMVVELDDLSEFGVEMDRFQNLDLGHLSTDGALYGDLNDIHVDILTEYDMQALGIQGNFNRIKKTYRWRARMNQVNLDRLNIGLPVTKISGDFNGEGKGLEPDKIELNTLLTLDELNFANGFEISDLKLEANIKEQEVSPVFSLSTGQSLVSGDGYLSWGDFYDVDLRLNAERLNIKEFISNEGVSETSINTSLQLQAGGSTLNDAEGTITLDVFGGTVSGDSVKPHQLYADVIRNVNEDAIRLTSTVADAELEGLFEADYWLKVWKHWKNPIAGVPQKVFLRDTTQQHLSTDQKENIQFENRRTEILISIKDPGLIKTYYPDFPEVQAKSLFTANLETSPEKVILVGDINTENISWTNYGAKNLNTKVTYTINQTEQDDIRANWILNASADSLFIQDYVFSDILAEHQFEEDSLSFALGSNSSIETSRFGFEVDGLHTNDSLALNLKHFFLGNTTYAWEQNGEADITLLNDYSLIIRNLELGKENGKFSANGVLSSSQQDSMRYELRDIQLGELSDLLNLPTRYSGTLNGAFTSRTLGRVPDVDGQISIQRFALDENILGDINMSSHYNLPKDQFDVRISAMMNGRNYPEYFIQNDSVATDIFISGYVKNPATAAGLDTLYEAELNISSIDLWLLNYLIPPIFSSIDGFTQGSGKIAGNTSSFDFISRFSLNDVKVVPLFLETNFALTGDIEFGYDEGVVFNNVLLTDDRNGTGRINGVLDLNQFQPGARYDMTVNFNELQFLNNSFSPDVPFYGDVTGTGVVKLSGPSDSPYLETTTPVITTSSSRLSVPLLDETKVENQRTFVEFVETLNMAEITRNQKLKSEEQQLNQQNQNENGNQRTFTELFRLNLQFNTPDNTTFELVFDPVTNEILTARGGGDLNITLEDEELRMFGSFDVFGGEYLFVGGDVLSKRFNISDGGTLSWEGDPQNPRINLTATYRARPNFEPINGNDVRIPVVLVLKLSGTINSLQNDFYFEIPSDTYQDAETASSVKYLLNSEDQKLAQATSLLLTNSFFPVNGGAGNTNAGLTNNLQNNATQVGLSQLLSNQINNLLSSSISNLDIDLNLNGFDQADLGIALRLFNDRLVLRREGQLTGERTGTQSVVGDLGASYQLSRAISVEVFYRQDPSLSNYGTIQDQTQNVSGLGLQYQVQFNAWRELPSKVWNNILSLFGIREEKDEQTDQPV